MAKSIYKGLGDGGFDTLIKKVQEADDVNFYDYDLICFGVPSYQWHPPKLADEYLKAKFAHYKTEGRIQLNSPCIGGKNALVFCSY